MFFLLTWTCLPEQGRVEEVSPILPLLTLFHTPGAPCAHMCLVLWILVTCGVLHSQDHSQDTERHSKGLLHALPLQPGFPDYSSPLQTITTVLQLYSLKKVKEMESNVK